MKIMIDVPDEQVRECMDRALENGTTCEEEMKAALCAGLVKVRAPDDVLSITTLFDRVAKNIIALPVGTQFSIHDVLGKLVLSPNVKKALGKTLAVEAIEQNGYIRDGKTVQNLSMYKRV